MARKESRKKNPAFFISSLVLLALFSLYLGSFFIFPDIAALSKHAPDTTAFMEFRMQQWNDAGKKKRIDRRWVGYNRISPYMVKAVIISEDAKFWVHEGFDFDAIHYAIEKDIKARTFKLGASTITQQLAKNLYLNPSKNPVRKIKEAILTWRIEKTLSKRRILEIYLNVIEWGDGIFGIEAAAQRYFNKSAADLAPLEAARLASVLPNPIKYNPLSQQRFVSRRSATIYKIMLKRGMVVETTDSINDTLHHDSVGIQNTPWTPEMQINDLVDSLTRLDKDSGTWFSDSAQGNEAP
jgi:monofunctional biosynthetic peptidoglycan transglycosylase